MTFVVMSAVTITIAWSLIPGSVATVSGETLSFKGKIVQKRFGGLNILANYHMHTCIYIPICIEN